MSIWDTEIVRANGDLYAFIRVQNEFTGNISGSFRRIYKDKDGYYAKADGKKNYLTNKVVSFRESESRSKDYRDFYYKYKDKIGGFTC